MLMVLGFLLSFSSPSLLFAQETSVIGTLQPFPSGGPIDPEPRDPPLVYPEYPPPSMPTGLYELALFDKKGGVQIAGKIILDEIDKENLSNFSFVIPGKNVVLAGVVDEKWVYKKTCFDTYPRPLPGDVYNLDDSVQSASSKPGSIAPNDMPQYCPPQYMQVFTTINPTVENIPNGVKVTLKISPKNDKTQESLLFLYRTNSYTNQFLSNFSYHFDTVKIPVSVNSVQVGILLRDGLYLRGTSAYANAGRYIPSFRAIEKAKNLFEEENQELVTLTNEIAYQGMLRKGDSDMTPDSSFTVSGVYGTNVLLLYVREIVTALILLTLCIAGIIYGIKRFFHTNIHLKTILITVVITLVLAVFIAAFVLLLIYFLRNMGLAIPAMYKGFAE